MEAENSELMGRLSSLTPEECVSETYIGPIENDFREEQRDEYDWHKQWYEWVYVTKKTTAAGIVVQYQKCIKRDSGSEPWETMPGSESVFVTQGCKEWQVNVDDVPDFCKEIDVSCY